MTSFWDSKTVLITGGTGSLGTALAERLLAQPIRALRILSRDEDRQAEWARTHTDVRLRLFLGDVRDRDRLRRAFREADIVIHCAALKRADSIEYNAIEAVRTNVVGSENVVEAAIDAGVQQAVLVSTDKAVWPASIYGATKMIAEQLFLHPYTGVAGPLFSVCRFGNLLGSRGSIVPLLREQAQSGEVTVTDVRCSRFVLTLPEAAGHVIAHIESGHGGLFIPPMRALRLFELVQAIAPGAKVRRIGLRKGEKLHEQLSESGDESCDGEPMSVAEIRAMLEGAGV